MHSGKLHSIDTSGDKVVHWNTVHKCLYDLGAATVLCAHLWA